MQNSDCVVVRLLVFPPKGSLAPRIPWGFLSGLRLYLSAWIFASWLFVLCQRG